MQKCNFPVIILAGGGEIMVWKTGLMASLQRTETEMTESGTETTETGNDRVISGYIVMLRARMFRSLISRTGIKERNIRARNITI